jgi:hypothetical protein
MSWPDYNTALKNPGSLTIWFDPAMCWTPQPSGKRGRQQAYSDAAIHIRAAILNGFTALGVPETVALAQIRPEQGEVRHQAELCNKAL